MEDWTDIFGEELRNFEETLPADDWAVVQQKYSAAKRRRKALLWSLTGVASAVAAALAVFVVLFADGSDSPSGLPVIADSGISCEEQPEQETVEALPETVTPARPVSFPSQEPVRKTETVTSVKEKEDILVAEAEGDEIDVIRDTVRSEIEVLVADSEPVNTEADEWIQGEWIGEDAPERKMSRKHKVSIAVSGSSALVGGGIIPKPMMDMDIPQDPSEDFPNIGPEDPPVGGQPDTTDVSGISARVKASYPASRQKTRNTRSLRSTDMEHHMPVSYGVSLRFPLTERFSLNTGLNYTLYTSKRTRNYSDGSVETDKQMVHYLGIPLRCDWMVIKKPRFGMYLGVGGQVDKCIYAKVGNQRLYDPGFLYSVNSVVGVQYNITPRVCLYAEPELTGNIGYSEIDTYRRDAEVMITARLGVRINL